MCSGCPPTGFPPWLIPLAYQQHPPLLPRDSLLSAFWGYNPKHYIWIAAASTDLLTGQPTTGVTLFKGDLQSLLNFSDCLVSMSIFTVFEQLSQAHHAYFLLQICQQIMAIYPFAQSNSQNFVFYEKWHCKCHMGWQVTDWTACTLGFCLFTTAPTTGQYIFNQTVNCKIKEVAAIFGNATGTYWSRAQQGRKFKCCLASLLWRKASFTLFKTKIPASLTNKLNHMATGQKAVFKESEPTQKS